MRKVETRWTPPEPPQVYVDKYRGWRVGQIGLAKVPEGWVAGADFPPEIWERIKFPILPISPGGRNPEAVRKAERVIEQRKEEFGEVFFFVYRDRECVFSWAVGAAIVQDLERDPFELFKEAREALAKEDKLRHEMKRGAYLLITGNLV